MMVFLAIFQTCDLLGSLLITCEFCQQISNAFGEINDDTQHLFWYRYPDEIQRILPMISMATQQPVEFRCIGSVSCSRETFKKVCSVQIHIGSFHV